MRQCCNRAALILLAWSLLVSLSGCAEMYAPPGGGYKKVSELVKFPDFYPGLGTLYVRPETIPIGPFRAYDREGRLVSSIYMVPMRELDAHTMHDLVRGTPVRVDHVDLHYTNGHPGVGEPHYHIILWHVSPEDASRLQ